VYSLKFYILWLLITKFLSMCALFRTLLSFYTKITSLDMKTNISLMMIKNSASVQTLSYLKLNYFKKQQKLVLTFPYLR